MGSYLEVVDAHGAAVFAVAAGSFGHLEVTAHARLRALGDPAHSGRHVGFVVRADCAGGRRRLRGALGRGHALRPGHVLRQGQLLRWIEQRVQGLAAAAVC